MAMTHHGAAHAARDIQSSLVLHEARSERIVGYVRLALSVLFLLVSKGIEKEIPHHSVVTLYIGTSAYFLFSFIMILLLKYGCYRPWLKYMATCVDVLLLSTVIWSFGTYRSFKTEAYLLYYVWLALAAMRFSFSLVLLAGGLILASYITMTVAALMHGTISTGSISESFVSEKVSLTNIIVKLVYISIVTIILSYGSRAYRRLMSKAFEAELETERHRQRSMHMESLGLLAGGIAHDFNNALTAILNNVANARRTLLTGSRESATLEQAEAAVRNAQTLTLQLLTFAKGGAPVKKTVSLGGLISDTATFVSRGSNIRCEMDISENLRTAEADIGQISQVIGNLVINAIQAMPGGGVIKVKAENVAISSKAGSSIPGLNDGTYIKVSVSDHGPGIPAEVKARIFDPYFTTKQEGSGLGLTASIAIADKHNGTITVDSEPGKGALFSLYLPASDASPDAIHVTFPEFKSIPGASILLMEDEPLIAMSVLEGLKHFGHNVELARDGHEAINLYMKAMSAGRKFDLVLIDLTIAGGMGGVEAMKKLREIDPSINAHVASGYSTDPVMSNYREYGFSGVIPKPYAVEDVLIALQQTRS